MVGEGQEQIKGDVTEGCAVSGQTKEYCHMFHLLDKENGMVQAWVAQKLLTRYILQVFSMSNFDKYLR